MKKRILLFIPLVSLFLILAFPVSASETQIEINERSRIEMPALQNDNFLVSIPQTIETQQIKKVTINKKSINQTSINQDIYVRSYNLSNGIPNNFLTDGNGRYVIKLYTNETTSNHIAIIDFKIWGITSTQPEPEPNNPTDPPASNIDYTSLLNTIITRLNNLYSSTKNVAQQINDILNDDFISLKTSIDNAGQTTLTALNKVDTSINTLNSSVKTMQTAITTRLDVANNNLTTIIKELQTTKTVERNQLTNKRTPDEVKAPVPNQKYTDNTKYFDNPVNQQVNSDMPDMIEPKKWHDVDEPIELEQDKIGEKDDEIILEKELEQEKELEKNVFEQEKELEKIEFDREQEFESDSFTADSFEKTEQFQKDEFNNTDQFESTNQFEQDKPFTQDSEFKQTEQDYNLRWKSVNGVFQ